MTESGFFVNTLQNMEEAESALSLSIEAFYPKGAPSELVDLWRYKWFEDPSFKLNNVFVVRDRNSNMIGGLRVVLRTLKRADQVFRMFGIAETFVAPNQQGKGLSSLLTQYAIQKGRQRSYDILVVVARKLIDYFYLKYGTYGLGAYNEVLLRGWHDTIKKVNEFRSTDICLQDIDIINKAYEYSYFNCFGPMRRNSDHWKFLIEKISQQGRKSRTITRNGKGIGYFVTDEEEVVEISLLPGIPYRPVVDFLYCDIPIHRNSGELKLKIPHTHRLLDDDLQLDVTVRNRECYYGGHIVKILNVKKALTLMEERLGYSLAAITNKPIDLVEGNVKVRWNGKDAKASYSSDLDPSYQETLFLLGATSVYGQKDGWENTKSLPFVLCELDEF